MHDVALSEGKYSSAAGILHALQSELRSWDSLLQNLPLGVYVCDRDGAIVGYNQRAAELWGRSPVLQEDVGRFCGARAAYSASGLRLNGPDSPIGEVLRTGAPVRGRELVIEQPGGARLTVLANAGPILDLDGQMIGAVNCFEDITARRQAEEAASERELWYRRVLEVLPAAIYTTDSQGRITFFNQAAVELSGRRPELGTDQWCVSWRLFHPDGSPMEHSQCPMAVALKEKRPIRDAEAIAQRPDGTRVPFIPYPTPLEDAAGNVIGAVNMLVDISDRKQSEQLKQRLASIVESSDDAIVSKDLNGVISTWNQGAERLFGYTAEEMIGKPINVLIPDERHDEEPTILHRIRRGERINHYETIRRHKDGSLINISLTVSPLFDAMGKVVGASKIARDITGRKRSEERQKTLVDELNHRVKNTLATVQSLATQTMRGRGVPGDAIEALNSRLIALSRTHDQLSQARWEAADLKTVICEIVAPFDAEAPRRIRLVGDAVSLTPNAALTLTMVLHELVTNAVKYGSLSSPDGMLTIAWDVAVTDHDRSLHLTWEESGGPQVAEPASLGFGTRLLERAIVHELRGRVDASFEPSGFRCTVDVPLTRRPA